MKVRIFLVFILVAISIDVFSQTAKLDSLEALLKAHPQMDTVRVQLLIGLCTTSSSFTAAYKNQATEALQISENLKFMKGKGLAWGCLATYNWVIGEYEVAMRYAIQAQQFYEGTNDYGGLAKSYITLGIVEMKNKDLEKAKKSLNRAVAICERAGLKKHLAQAYNSLAGLSLAHHNNDEALEYYFKSRDIREQINDEEGLSQSYLNIGMMYMKLLDYDKAEINLEKGSEWLKKSANKYKTIGAYLNLGELHLRRKNYDVAEGYLEKAENLAYELKINEALREAYNLLSVLETERGRWKTAIDYIEIRERYKDSIFNEEKTRKIAEMEARYETAKKDQTITALEEQKELQSAKEFYLLCGFAAVVFCFGLFYILQRSHNRKVRGLLKVQQTLNAKLQEADRLRARFVANISHEFRTPLSLIIAPIQERLQLPVLPTKDREHFKMIERNAERLLSLVNQLLDLSKLEAGKMELHLKQGGLNFFLRTTAASFDSLAENKQVHFFKDIPESFDSAWYDADKLETILNNLLSNAFKFTPSGGTVTISAQLTYPTGQMMITVADSGCGIDIDEQEHIFTAFYQSKNLTDAGAGTGLGLTLVSELVKLHGGTLELNSLSDLGTIVSVTLPIEIDQVQTSVPVILSAVENSGEPVNDQKGYAGITQEIDTDEPGITVSESVLVIEDNDDLRRFISSQLARNYRLVTAKDGEEGFYLAKENIPSLIISDVMMPNLDGISLTRKIRSEESTSHIPLILLTAKVDLESRLEGFKAGVDDYLSKPFSTTELKVRVANLIAMRKKLTLKYRKEIHSPSILHFGNEETSLDEKFLVRLRTSVEKNIADPLFGVEQLAHELSLSRTQLFRKLKAVTGFSPNEYINELRLQKAAALILAKADTLTQISYAVGFSQQSYFAKRFRRKFGVAPSEYHEKMKATATEPPM